MATLEEIYGIEKAKLIKEKIRRSCIGKNKGKHPEAKLLLWIKENHSKMNQDRKGIKNPLRTKLNLIDNPAKRIEVRKKMSASALGNKKWLGKHHTEKSKDKIREYRSTQIFPSKDSKPEVKVQNFLKQLDIVFLTHQSIKEIYHSYQCDIFIPSMNLIIECDGDYWHKYPVGRDIDRIRTKELFNKGFKVLRLWEHEINNMNTNQFKERLTNNLRTESPKVSTT